MFTPSEEKIEIKLCERDVTTYLLVTADNRVHLMVPFIGGSLISSDNTCQTMTAMKNFLGRNPRSQSAKQEILKYKEALEYDLKQPLPPNVREAKRQRLEQINTLNRNLDIFLNLASTRDIPQGLSMNSFPQPFKSLMREKKNLYWILNRPNNPDGYLNGHDYVFAMKREGQSNFHHHILQLGRRLSPEMLQGGLANMLIQRSRARIIASEDETLHNIQQQIKNEMELIYNEIFPNEPLPTGESAFNFETFENSSIDDAYISMITGIDESELSLNDRINTLVKLFESRLNNLDPSPFNKIFDNSSINLEKYSIITQMYFGMINIYAYANGMTEKNFANILENERLAQAFETNVLSKINSGMRLEDAIIQFINENASHFFNSPQQQISEKQAKEIQDMLTSRYRIVADAPHFDEFMILHNTPLKPQTHFSKAGFICAPLEFLAPYYPELDQTFFSSYMHNRLNDEQVQLGNQISDNTLEYKLTDLIPLIRTYKSNPQHAEDLRILMLSKTSNGRFVFEHPQLKSFVDASLIQILSPHADQQILNRLNHIIQNYDYVHLPPDALEKLYLALIQQYPPSQSPHFRDARQIIASLLPLEPRCEVKKSSLGGHIALLPEALTQNLHQIIEEQRDKFYLSPLAAQKIYKAVERHYPERADEMNQLSNTSERGPEKFRFALQVLGINIGDAELIMPPKPNGQPKSPEGYIFNHLTPQVQNQMHELMSNFDAFQMQYIEGAHLSGFDGSASRTTLNCPENILQAFRDILSESRILGSQFYNPYSKQTETFPSNPNLLSSRHLQILARNQYDDDEGIIFSDLYDNLLTHEQIAKIRCLTKWTSVTSVLGYPGSNIIVIDQPSHQWQKNYYNIGSMFFYPDTPQSLPENYLEFQNNAFQACFSTERPPLPSDHQISISWDTYPGKLDLNLLEKSFELEFKQAWESIQTNNDVQRLKKTVNLRFFAAGLGSALGNLEMSAADTNRLYQTRLIGILHHLQHQTHPGIIGRLELPLSHLPNSPEINHLLSNIQHECERLRIQYAGTEMTSRPHEDVQGFVTAINTCGNVAVMPGGSKQPAPGARLPLRYQIANALAIDVCNAASNPQMKFNTLPNNQFDPIEESSYGYRR